MAIVFGSPEASRILDADRRILKEADRRRKELQAERREIEKALLAEREDNETLELVKQWRFVSKELAQLRKAKREGA